MMSGQRLMERFSGTVRPEYTCGARTASALIHSVWMRAHDTAEALATEETRPGSALSATHEMVASSVAAIATTVFTQSA